MLPFDAPGLPPLQIGELLIPRYECLTVSEALFFDQLEIQKYIDLMEQERGDRLLMGVLASALFISRVSPEWSLERVLILPDDHITESANFFLGERRRWRSLEAIAAAPKKEEPEPIDWSNLYWRLNSAYPNESRFNHQNFGNCPLILVEQALKALCDSELQRYSALATSTALLGVAMLAKKGAVEPKPEWFNPFQLALLKREAKEMIAPEAAIAFLELVESRDPPPWAVASIDMNVIRLAAGDEGGE